nr:hypothetical protein RU989_pgp107 [Laurencia obtusa]WMP12904.1 hypothetical protein [Laurencia obtusa]
MSTHLKSTKIKNKFFKMTFIYLIKLIKLHMLFSQRK